MEKYTIEINNEHKNLNLGKLVGGKALPLFELKRKNIEIPAGFVVTIDAYKCFFKENNLYLGFNKKKVNQKIIDSLREKIISSNFSEKIKNEIYDKTQSLKGKSFAVRSSAIVEDSQNKSWAGEFDSYLNVSKKDILLSIKKCWASLLNKRAIEYAGGISEILKIKMAVIVQNIIVSDVSGVCFTRNPLDKNDNDIRIEAIFGFGDLLVQGEVIPDSYLVEKGSNLILEVIVQKQELISRISKRGGMKVLSITGRYNQKLSNKEIIELAKIIKRIEKIHGLGRDIEWCKKGEKFFILQSRPIV